MKANKTIRLCGFLGGAPKMDYKDGQVKMARLSLATNEKKKISSGAKISQISWHQLVLRDHLVVIASRYLGKGAQVSVLGVPLIRYHKTRDGRRIKVTEILVNNMASPAVNQTRLFQ